MRKSGDRGVTTRSIIPPVLMSYACLRYYALSRRSGENKRLVGMAPVSTFIIVESNKTSMAAVSWPTSRNVASNAFHVHSDFKATKRSGQNNVTNHHSDFILKNKSL